MRNGNSEPFDRSYRFDWVYVAPARAAYDTLSDTDQIEFTRLIESDLCHDPWEDGVTKAPLQLDDGTLVTLYDDGRWQIVYLLVASHVIEILALSKDWFGAG